MFSVRENTSQMVTAVRLTIWLVFSRTLSNISYVDDRVLATDERVGQLK